MIIVFGRRAYGRVNAHGGEHAHTRFAHVYYLPIVPSGSFWVTQQLGDSVRGFEIRASGKSIAAAYLRMWAPLVAIGALVSASVAGTIVAVVLAAASAWAWSWRDVRGASAMRASDFRLLAFGTRCDPALMTRALRDDMKRALDARWSKLDTQRPPDEVAEHGANSSAEAVAAYGLLALAALDATDATARAKAAAAAQRLVDGAHDDVGAADGPYRAAAAATPALVFDEIASAADGMSAAKANVAQRAEPTRRRMSPIMKGAGFAAVAVVALSLSAFSLSAMREPPSVTFADVDGTHFSGTLVALHCDSIENIGELSNGKAMSACVMGDHIVPVLGTVDNVDAPVVGRLRLLSSQDATYMWPEDVVSSPRVSARYLRVESLAFERGLGIVSMLVLVGLFGLIVRTIVRRVRRAKHPE
ncbi:MAG TPA: hypothetical protein VH143_06970 [Kofleriaceae bacterium]|jgi:hypothetical protein|nr:hypothetical protein [Kofleriaceae bacterium]